MGLRWFRWSSHLQAGYQVVYDYLFSPSWMLIVWRDLLGRFAMQLLLFPEQAYACRSTKLTTSSEDVIHWFYAPVFKLLFANRSSIRRPQ